MRRSAPITWDQVRVGLVLMLALVILGFGIFFIGNIGDVFGTRYRLVTLMESAAGLVRGAPVQVAGQNVGQVDRVEFILPEERRESGETVAVWLGVNVSIRDQIRADSRARVRTQGLLGDRLIDIEPGSADSPVLADGDTLLAAPALSYEELLAQAADAVQALITLSNDLTATLGRVAATAGLDSVTAIVVEGQGTLGRLVRSDSLYLALASSASRADSLLALIERGEGAIGQLVTDERLYEELLKTVVDLNAFLQDVRENPKRFIPPVKVF